MAVSYKRGNLQNISTHAPRAGSDLKGLRRYSLTTRFQPTLPVRGATPRKITPQLFTFDFNPRSPCGERLTCISSSVSCIAISTHAPRAGSDIASYINWFRPPYFNPRSPCGERRIGGYPCVLFCYFNPRSPCGERPACTQSIFVFGLFQPTLPVRGATLENFADGFTFVFQPTLPVRGATPPSPARRCRS